jgi:hypothetical protein
MQVTFTPLYSDTFRVGAIFAIAEINGKSDSEPKNLYGRFWSLQQGLSALKKFLDNPSYGVSYGPDTGLQEYDVLPNPEEGALVGTPVVIEIEVASDGRFSFRVPANLPMHVFGIPRSGSLQLEELITMLEERISPQ